MDLKAELFKKQEEARRLRRTTLQVEDSGEGGVERSRAVSDKVRCGEVGRWSSGGLLSRLAVLAMGCVAVVVLVVGGVLRRGWVGGACVGVAALQAHAIPLHVV